MDDEENADLVKLSSEVLTNPEDLHFMERHFSTTAYDATKKGILTRLHILLTSEVFRNFLVGESSFHLESLLREKKTILFNLKDISASGQDSAFNAIGRFIVARLIGIVFRHRPAPIHFFLDEAHNYSTPAISKILTEARKFGLYLTLSNQSVSQFDNQVRDDVRKNTLIKITGRQPDEALTDVAKMTGTTSETLRKLTTGVFFVRMGQFPGFLVKGRSDLCDPSNPYVMSPDEWEVIKTAQLKRYYRCLESTPEPPEDSADPSPVKESPDHRELKLAPKLPNPLNP